MYDLVGIDGNAFSIIGYCRNCMRRENFTDKEIEEYTALATSSDYNHLLAVSVGIIDKCNERFIQRSHHTSDFMGEC